MPLTPSDLIAIERLYAEYNHAIHNGDPAAWVNCFTADGVFSNIARTVVGTDALTAYAVAFMQDRGTRYLVNNIVVEADGVRARGTCYLTVLRLGTADEPTHIELTGIYTDLLVSFEGRWRFARRHIQRDV